MTAAACGCEVHLMPCALCDLNDVSATDCAHETRPSSVCHDCSRTTGEPEKVR